MTDYADKSYLKYDDKTAIERAVKSVEDYKIEHARHRLGHEFGWLNKDWTYTRSEDTNIRRTMELARRELMPDPFGV